MYPQRFISLLGTCSSLPVSNGRVMMDLVKLGDIMAAEQCSKVKKDKFRPDWPLGYDFSL